jgi:hypothetical protein
MVTNGPMESAVPSWRRAQPRLTVGGKTRHLDASSDSEKCPLRISTHKSLAPYRECRGWKSLAERNKVRAAALSIGTT